MRTRRRRPATPTDTFDESPAPTPDPADRVTLDDSLRLALHMVLERLSPAERTAFVLHDVFQYSFDEVGEIVGRSPAACRQLASRARQRIRSEAAPARFSVEPAAQHLVTERFIAACSAGDVEQLLTVLDPDVAGDVDFGQGPFVRPNQTPELVAETLVHFFGPASGITLLSVPVPDGAAVAAFEGDHLNALIGFDLKDGAIAEVHVLLDPARLAPLQAALVGG
jgi:RNA polymerase sigma-70 factor (ECF subfamily)